VLLETCPRLCIRSQLTISARGASLPHRSGTRAVAQGMSPPCPSGTGTIDLCQLTKQLRPMGSLKRSKTHPSNKSVNFAFSKFSTGNPVLVCGRASNLDAFCSWLCVCVRVHHDGANLIKTALCREHYRHGGVHSGR